MHYPIEFDKTRAEKIIDALWKGKSVPSPANGVWSPNDLVILAGVSSYIAHIRATVNQEEQLAAAPLERREAFGESLDEGIKQAVDFVGYLVQLIGDKEYDDKYEQSFRGFVGLSDDGKPEVVVD
jgi:hypothetical protein